MWLRSRIPLLAVANAGWGVVATIGGARPAGIVLSLVALALSAFVVARQGRP